MKAVITEERSNAVNYGGQKELVSEYNVVVVSKGKVVTPVTARCYMGRSASASVVYASVWVHGKVHTSGAGKAGGYGYHKESAAIAEALESAGVELYGDNYDSPDENKAGKGKRVHFGGCGDTAIRAALVAVARAAGYRGAYKIV